MRRKDRELTERKDITNILDKCEVMRLALCLDNQPYIVPMNFAYDIKDSQLCIYLHSALEGKKIELIKKNNNVCFEVDCSHKIIQAEQACKWSAEFESVIGEGNIILIDDDAQKKVALDVFMKKHGFDVQQSTTYNLASVLILKIIVSHISGKARMK